MEKKKNILLINGSLRSESANHSLLKALIPLAPDPLDCQLYGGVDQLPFFNPDLDQEESSIPESVRGFRLSLAEADGIVISTPEYVHGIPGGLKNAIDWAVSSGSFVGKPMVLINVSAGDGTQLQEMLGHTLTVLEAQIVSQVSLYTSTIRKSLDSQGKITYPVILKELDQAMSALVSAVGAVAYK